MDRKIVFVSNVPGGFPNVLEHVKKPFSSKALCKLHELTRHVLGTRGDWREFVSKLDIHTEFISRDRVPLRYPKALYKKYPSSLGYPCVLLVRKESVEVLITPAEIEACMSLEELKDLVAGKVLALK
jgi:hypothetical protein